MGWQELRGRLVFMAMSAFVVWHTLAILIPPSYRNSALTQPLLSVFRPYLTLLRLNNRWDFYAPVVNTGTQLRYVVESADGHRRIFTPSDEWSWYHPGYFWFRAWDDAVIGNPDRFGDRAIALICWKHAALRPTAITLRLVVQQDFTPEDHLAGRHPMDPEFVITSTLKHGRCPSP